jgi:inhibitor of cysteine peptidase
MQSERSGRRFRTGQGLIHFLLLAIVFCPQRSFAETKVVTDADKGGDVQMKVGDKLEVRLKSNPSTGYMWYLHPKSTALLKLRGEKHADATDQPTGQPTDQSTQPAVGRPILQVFTFEPRRKGDGILLLRYVRSWEKPALGEEQFTLHVVIE